MKGKFGHLSVFFALALMVIFPALSQAADPAVKEGMPQGDFAVWLVKSAYALQNQKQNSPVVAFAPGANADNAVRFLAELGFVPEGGWQKDSPLTKAQLASLLPNGDGSAASFDDLVAKVQEYFQGVFDQHNPQSSGAFNIQSSGTPSAVA